MKGALFVGIGGFLGSIARYLTGVLVLRILGVRLFPLATLSVNVVGCLLIGLFIGLAEQERLGGQDVRLFLIVGLLGGFTTFSAFGFDTFTMLRGGNISMAMVNVSTNVVFGLTAVWVGVALAKVL